MKKATLILGAIFVIVGMMAFTPQQQETKVYKLELTAQETQIIFDALGELPAKTSEGIRVKIYQQVQKQNTETK